MLGIEARILSKEALLLDKQDIINWKNQIKAAKLE